MTVAAFLNRIMDMRMKKIIYTILLIMICMALFGCKRNNTDIVSIKELEKTGSMDLKYATAFSVDYYRDGYRVIHVDKGDDILVVPKGADVPECDDDIVVVKQPIENMYMVSSSAMDLVCELGVTDNVRFTGTKYDELCIEKAKKAVDNGEMFYAGKYNEPDFELLLEKNCDIAVQNTMIYHNPGVKDKLNEVGIPVIVELSSMEGHPLGRVEWIKFYGVLFGREKEAEAFFENQLESLKEIQESISSGERPKVAYFFVTSNGAVNVRKSGDYIAKMIETAGAEYVFDDLTNENALSTINIQMEEFVEKAMNADYLIYNSSIDGELNSVEELLTKCPQMKDSVAVKNNNVFCTSKNMFQQTTGTVNMILDMHNMISGNNDFRYLFRVKDKDEK